MNPTRRAILAAAPLLLGAQEAPAAARASIGAWGFDTAGMDLGIKPGDDFFAYAGGRWLAATEIPEDRASWGPFFALRAKVEADVRAIVDELVARRGPAGSDARRIADYYSAYADEATIEASGLQPAQADLDAIAGARTHEEIARLCVRRDLATGGPFSIDIWADDRDPDSYVVNISQGGLGMPSRETYLDTRAGAAEIREKYRAYAQALLALAGWPDPEGAARRILAVEVEIAALHWPAAKRADRNLTYNPRSRAELKAMAPGFPWDEALEAQEISGQDRFGAKEPDAIQALAALFRRTPVETWRDYLALHYLNGAADVLPRAFDDLAFDFNGRTLSGQPRKRDRWRRATAALNAALGEAVGRIYVRRHFPRESKARMLALVETLRAAFRARIARAEWMSPPTRHAALLKLEKLRIKIGYPDVWRDYTTLEVRPHDPLGNRARARVWDWRRRVGRLGQRTDREEWGMTPQTVNAYYNAFFNEIVFPAAILQAPYFDPAADPAVNYGGIGAVIGHEMSHGFDDQGSKSDAEGRLRSWWTPDDLAQFEARTAVLVRQYAGYEALPGLFLDGKHTLGENIGDNSGLLVALEAYRLSLHGHAAPVLDGFSGEQRFFLSWAQTYREKVREPQLRQDVATDPHSPARFRVNGVVRNIDAWYDAFGVAAGDRLYLPAQERVRLW